MNSHYGESVEGGFCPYLDQCVLLYLSEEGVVDWLKQDFHRHYDTNRRVGRAYALRHQQASAKGMGTTTLTGEF